jgi:hypothetical protein
MHVLTTLRSPYWWQWISGDLSRSLLKEYLPSRHQMGRMVLEVGFSVVGQRSGLHCIILVEHSNTRTGCTIPLWRVLSSNMERKTFVSSRPTPRRRNQSKIGSSITSTNGLFASWAIRRAQLRILFGRSIFDRKTCSFLYQRTTGERNCCYNQA